MNVGVAYMGGSTQYFDLLVTNQTSYRPHDSSQNVLNGLFATINLACNEQVALRVSTVKSCATASSCGLCDQLGEPQRGQCYQSGCSCFGTTVTSAPMCSGAQKESHRRMYSCPGLAERIVLPAGTMVTMTVFDFDTGPNGDYVERFIAPGYAYYRTPLRAASGNEVASTLLVDRATHTFTSTALGDVSDNPTDPQELGTVVCDDCSQCLDQGFQEFWQARDS